MVKPNDEITPAPPKPLPAPTTARTFATLPPVRTVKLPLKGGSSNGHQQAWPLKVSADSCWAARYAVTSTLHHGSRSGQQQASLMTDADLSHERRSAMPQAITTTAVTVKRRQVLIAVIVGVVVVAFGAAATSVAVITSNRGVVRSPTQQAPSEMAMTARDDIQNLPPQAAALAYGNPDEAASYAYPGGLVVAGRDNYHGKAFKNVSAKGGTVLVYLNAIIDNSHGRYHRLLNERSQCGPATSRWPRNYKANSWGYLNDFRVGSVLQRKLECVLEKMVAENPHMAGWFADDLGSRYWFPDLDWASFPDKAAYRDGAIALTKTFRKVADRHHLIFLVNGTWIGGSVATAGGGYPNPAKSGNALAEGGVVEHHDGEIGFFAPYGCSKQWAEQSPITHGKAFNYAVTSSHVGTTEYVKSGCYAFVNDQTRLATSHAWGTTHPTGLPTHAR
jgi:hypothetical protein